MVPSAGKAVLIGFLIVSMMLGLVGPAAAGTGLPRGADGVVEYWAVVVGISDYPYWSPFPDLTYADDDANELYAELLKYDNWSAGNIEKFVNSQASKSSIQGAVERLGGYADSDDVFVFYFAGHGTNHFDVEPFDESDGLDEYLVPWDASNDPGTMIRDDELGVWLSTINTQNVAVIIDTCKSGGFLRGTETDPTVSAKGDGFAQDLLGAFETRDPDDNAGVVVLTASDDDESAYAYPALQNGVFTYYLLQGLKAPSGPADMNHNGDVSVEELYDYVYPRVVTYVTGQGQVQNPQLYDAHAGELAIAIDTTVRIDVPPEVPEGSFFDVTVSIFNVQDIDTYNIDIIYPPALIQVVGAEGGSEGVTPGMVDSTAIPMDGWNYVPVATPGVMRVIGNVPGLPCVDGSGYLFVIHFQAVGSACNYADIQFNLVNSPPRLKSQLFDCVGNEITPVTWVDGSVHIVEGGPTETVSTPTTPGGPSAGEVDQTLSFTTGGAVSNLGHSVEYRYDWGDGSFSSWSSSTGASHSWSTVGTKTVSAQARCATHTTIVSDWSAGKTVNITEAPPEETVSTPNTPSGPSDGWVGQTLSFTTGGSTSNLGHSVQYRYDWNDGTFSNWSSSIGASHSWSTVGTKTVKAQARCATHTTVVSDWSGGKAVEITSPPTDVVVEIEDASLPVCSTDSVDIWVRNFPVGDYGLGAYAITIGYDPAMIEVLDVSDGDDPFDDPLFNINTDSVGITQFSTAWPGPMGDVRIADLEFHCLAEGETTLTLTIDQLANVNGDPIAATPVDGTIIQSTYISEIIIAAVQDGDDVVVIEANIDRVKDPQTGVTVPGVAVADYQARALYDTTGIQMLGVRPGDAPFDSPTSTIDSPVGTTSFEQDTVAGAEPAVTVARLVPRLTGCADTAYELQVTFDLIATPGGGSVPQEAPQILTFRRGDINGDGTVDIIDGMMGAQYLVGLRPVGDINPLNMASVQHDDNGDLKTIVDCMFIAQYQVGIRNNCFELVI